MSADFLVCTYWLAGRGKDDNHNSGDALADALKENPRNASISIPVKDSADGPAEGPVQLALLTSKLWAPGRTLRVGFTQGTQCQQDKVRYFAPQWGQYANIKFDFPASGPYDISISFDPQGGSWSYLGTDSTRFTPSMNLGWIMQDRRDDDLRQVILHEFGHALGCVHEHQSPLQDIVWNKEQVYTDLGGPPNNWSRDKVDSNMFKKYDFTVAQQRMFDLASIMLYYFPASWTVNGQGTPRNVDLSLGDKDYIQFCYPGGNDIDAGQFNTLELRPWYQPSHATQKKIILKGQYQSAPRIAVGLNFLDIDQAHNIRVKARADNNTTRDFDAHLNSWADTNLYAAGLTYLELAPRFDAVQSGSWDTQYVRPWNQPTADTSQRINFSNAFTSPPKVVVFLTGLDMDKGRNWRVIASAQNIDSHGFTIHIGTWADSTLYQATATWLAYPADSTDIFSGRFDTRDVRPWNRPAQDTSGVVTFPASTNGKTPKVMLALDSLDYQCGKNLRCRLGVESVDSRKMVWHLQSWADSVQYSAGAQWFAWV